MTLDKDAAQARSLRSFSRVGCPIRIDFCIGTHKSKSFPLLSLPCYGVKLATLVSFAVLLVNSTTLLANSAILLVNSTTSRDFCCFTREFNDFTREFRCFTRESNDYTREFRCFTREFQN
ncbi:hypothetical protein QRD90_03505 [Peribacillus frigoritolerans]|uniref:hypothetical protein n=1 Tax=Peribacillus frigoritolerans TaxID=450367 RepID=UPI00207A3487|nr:hypothetical protein [Peribacillus frigoritolerans]USK81038.1 hypothetical protein LHV56_03500 [Peribacillus frigoritolerans]WJE48321.1 hypothetical protein QRD90_03505 [Peribacillus frigoritolerans]